MALVKPINYNQMPSSIIFDIARRNYGLEKGIVDYDRVLLSEVPPVYLINAVIEFFDILSQNHNI